MKTKPDLFGFLPCRWTIEFDGGGVSPVLGYDEAEAWVKERTNKDGFLYPPLVRQVKWDLWTNEPEEEVPRTKRPALLYRLPASHTLCLSDLGTTEEHRKGPGGFIIHLLGYLFGTRLQFYDWWFNGRVPTQRPTHNISFTEATAQDFLSHCYRTWRGWTEKEQRLITNVLHMHSRAPSYEWDWERFTIEYMALDGCWKLAKQRYGFREEGHANRIRVLCDTFTIPYDSDLARRIVKLRNDLFHETLWDGSQPGTAVSEDAFRQPDNLRRLNQRLIPAVLGYETPYIKTPWWKMGTFSFNQPLRPSLAERRP